MTAAAIRLLVLFAAAAMPCVGRAQNTPDPRRQQRPPDAVGQHKPEADAPAFQIDITRVRKALSLPPPVLGVPKDVAFDLPMPRFHEEVDVIAFKGPLPLTFAEQLKASEEADRYPYVYAPSIGDLAASVPDLQYLHPVNAILGVHKAISKAVYNRKVSKTRREVELELKALLASQAPQQSGESKPVRKDK